MQPFVRSHGQNKTKACSYILKHRQCNPLFVPMVRRRLKRVLIIKHRQCNPWFVPMVRRRLKRVLILKHRQCNPLFVPMDTRCKLDLKRDIRGRNSSLVVFGLAVHSVAGSILLWGHFPEEGIFPLELAWVQTPFPRKLFRMRVETEA